MISRRCDWTVSANPAFRITSKTLQRIEMLWWTNKIENRSVIAEKRRWRWIQRCQHDEWMSVVKSRDMAVFIDRLVYYANILALYLLGRIHQPYSVHSNPLVFLSLQSQSPAVLYNCSRLRRNEAKHSGCLYDICYWLPRSNPFDLQQSQLAWSMYLEVSSLWPLCTNSDS